MKGLRARCSFQAPALAGWPFHWKMAASSFNGVSAQVGVLVPSSLPSGWCCQKLKVLEGGTSTKK